MNRAVAALNTELTTRLRTCRACKCRRHSVVCDLGHGSWAISPVWPANCQYRNSRAEISAAIHERSGSKSTADDVEGDNTKSAGSTLEEPAATDGEGEGIDEEVSVDLRVLNKDFIALVELAQEWQDVRDEYMASRRLLIPTTLVFILQRLADLVRPERLGRRERMDMKVLLDGVARDLARKVGELEAGEVAVSTWALGRLGRSGDARLLKALMHQALQKRQDFEVPWAAHMLAGLAMAGTVPPQEWTAALLQALMPRLEGCDINSAAQLIEALALLERPAPQQLLDTFLALSEEQLELIDPATQANTLWALHCLGCAPPPSWMDAFCDALLERLALMPPGQLTLLMDAFAELGYYPGEEILSRWADALAPFVKDLAPEDVLQAIHGLARLHADVPPELLAGLLRRASVTRSGWPLPEVSQLLADTATLSSHFQDQAGWVNGVTEELANLCYITEPALQRASVTILVTLVASLAALQGFGPPQQWLVAHEAAVTGQTDRVGPDERRRVLECYAVLCYDPSRLARHAT